MTVGSMKGLVRHAQTGERNKNKNKQQKTPQTTTAAAKGKHVCR